MPQQSNPALIEEMRWQLQKIQERKAQNERALGDLAKSGGTPVVSPDGAVTVVTAPGGVVTEVRLAEHAMRTDAGTLGRMITTTIRTALAASPPAAQRPTQQPAQPPQPPRPQRPKRTEELADEEPITTVFD